MLCRERKSEPKMTDGMRAMWKTCTYESGESWNLHERWAFPSVCRPSFVTPTKLRSDGEVDTAIHSKNLCGMKEQTAPLSTIAKQDCPLSDINTCGHGRGCRGNSRVFTPAISLTSDRLGRASLSDVELPANSSFLPTVVDRTALNLLASE